MRLQDQLIRRYVTAASVSTAIVVADLVTKRYASVHFADSPLEIIPDFLTFTYTENSGGAFSLFQNGGQIIGVLAIAVTIFVLGMLRRPRPMLELIALSMVVGGALGNVFDRLFRGDGFLDGSVIDWIILWWIPTFNIADASVTIAVGLLFIQAWRTK